MLLQLICWFEALKKSPKSLQVILRKSSTDHITAAIATVVLVHSLIRWCTKSKALAPKVLGIANFTTPIRCDTQCCMDSEVTVWGLVSDRTTGKRLPPFVVIQAKQSKWQCKMLWLLRSKLNLNLSSLTLLLFWHSWSSMRSLSTVSQSKDNLLLSLSRLVWRLLSSVKQLCIFDKRSSALSSISVRPTWRSWFSSMLALHFVRSHVTLAKSMSRRLRCSMRSRWVVLV